MVVGAYCWTGCSMLELVVGSAGECVYAECGVHFTRSVFLLFPFL